MSMVEYRTLKVQKVFQPSDPILLLPSGIEGMWVPVGSRRVQHSTHSLDVEEVRKMDSRP